MYEIYSFLELEKGLRKKYKFFKRFLKYSASLSLMIIGANLFFNDPVNIPLFFTS